MAALTIQDHTAIVEFCLRNRQKLRGRDSTKSALDLIKDAIKLAKGDKIEATLVAAATEIKVFDAELRQDPLTDKVWKEGLPVLARVLVFEGSVANYENFLRKEASKAQGTLKITLKTAADILADGAGTIYNPEHWVMETIWDPRQITGTAGAAWANVKDKVKDVIVGDVGGAIIGGLSGAVSGAVKGGAKGAAQGAMDGAVSGAVSGSAGSVA